MTPPRWFPALSIRQPYAFAICLGFKPVENRDWSTRFRAPVLIHAGKKEERDDVDGVMAMIAEQTGSDEAVVRRAYERHRGLGGIVGAAEVVDCVEALDCPWFSGPFGFVMRDAVPLGGCVPCRGYLGFFQVGQGILRDLCLAPHFDAAAWPLEAFAHLDELSRPPMGAFT